ncbi:MAG TPA: hypothetical protein VH117_10495 [Edaphobacter sp.]|jgi:hypothetical protein|nr:hypothetical protein [Edaphobacter sp.]
MTDKEIALELGTRLIKAKLRVAAMVGELDTYRDSEWNPVPWRRHVDEILQETLLHVAQERVEELTHALDAAKPEDLLRILHKSLEELKY